MRQGRPPKGVHHVDRLQGPEDLKRRLKVVLETIVGSRSIEAACAALGVSESRLHEMRQEALVGALGALMPKPAGRPAKPPTETTKEQELRARIDRLEEDLQAAYVRTELALAMPHLFRRKKNRSKPRMRRDTGDGGTGT